MRSSILILAAVCIAACRPSVPADPLDRQLPADPQAQQALADTLPEPAQSDYRIYLTAVRGQQNVPPATQLTVRQAAGLGAAMAKRRIDEDAENRRGFYVQQLGQAAARCQDRGARAACIARENAELNRLGVPGEYRLR